jgi:lysozyme family protein
MNFEQAFDILMTHEGGFSYRPFSDDPGGATKYGVTEKVARANGYVGKMEDFTLDFAKQIYRKDYWDACQCDVMPDSIRYPLFDAAVNSGVAQSIKWLQSAVGVKSDGIMGSVTKQSVNMAAPQVLRQKMLGIRLRFMTGLSNWSANAKGWSRRIAAILEM